MLPKERLLPFSPDQGGYLHDQLADVGGRDVNVRLGNATGRDTEGIDESGFSLGVQIHEDRPSASCRTILGRMPVFDLSFFRLCPAHQRAIEIFVLSPAT